MSESYPAEPPPSYEETQQQAASAGSLPYPVTMGAPNAYTQPPYPGYKTDGYTGPPYMGQPLDGQTPYPPQQGVQYPYGAPPGGVYPPQGTYPAPGGVYPPPPPMGTQPNYINNQNMDAMRMQMVQRRRKIMLMTFMVFVIIMVIYFIARVVV